MSDEAVAEVEQPKPPTREEVIAKVIDSQLANFEKADHAYRLQIAERRGFVDPSVELTYDELKELIPQREDRRTYITLAKNSQGILAMPKQRGRRKKHFTNHQLDIKSESLRIFKRLFAAKAERLKAVCAKEEIEYIGVPESAIPELGARAAKQAISVVAERNKRKRDKARRRQQFSRKVNAGIFGMNNPGERNYVECGGQYK